MGSSPPTPQTPVFLLANFCREMVECFNKIARDTECRAVVISGAGKIFSAGKGGCSPPPQLLAKQAASAGVSAAASSHPTPRGLMETTETEMG